MMPTSLLWLPISRALNSRCSDGGKKQSRLTRRCYERAKQQASIGKGGQAGCRQDQHPILLYDCSKEYNCLILFMFTAKPIGEGPKVGRCRLDILGKWLSERRNAFARARKSPPVRVRLAPWDQRSSTRFIAITSSKGMAV